MTGFSFRDCYRTYVNLQDSYSLRSALIENTCTTGSSLSYRGVLGYIYNLVYTCYFLFSTYLNKPTSAVEKPGLFSLRL